MASAQKSSSLISNRVLQNGDFSEEFRESVDEMEDASNASNDLTKSVLKGVRNESAQSDANSFDLKNDDFVVDRKLSDNLNKVKLAEHDEQTQLVNQNRISSQQKTINDKFTPIKEMETKSTNHLVRRFKSGQDLDELIKGECRSFEIVEVRVFLTF